MAKFCTQCGAVLAEGIAFCTECGAKAEVPAAPQPVRQSVQQPVPVPRHVAQPVPQPIPQPAAEPESKTVSTAGFFWMILLFALPVVGWLACIILAFAPKNKNIKHFARAMLIWLLIAAILAGVAAFAVKALFRSVTPYVEEITGSFTGGTSGSLDPQQGESGSTQSALSDLDELQELIEQLEAMGALSEETDP